MECAPIPLRQRKDVLFYIVGEEFRFCSAVVLTVSLRRLSCKVRDFVFCAFIQLSHKKSDVSEATYCTRLYLIFFGKGKIGDVYSLIPSGVQVTCQERSFSIRRGGGMWRPFYFRWSLWGFYNTSKEGKLC